MNSSITTKYPQVNLDSQNNSSPVHLADAIYLRGTPSMKLTTRQMHEELNELEAKKVLEPGGCVVRCSKCGTANKVEVQTKIESS